MVPNEGKCILNSRNGTVKHDLDKYIVSKKETSVLCHADDEPGEFRNNDGKILQN